MLSTGLPAIPHDMIKSQPNQALFQYKINTSRGGKREIETNDILKQTGGKKKTNIYMIFGSRSANSIIGWMDR